MQTKKVPPGFSRLNVADYLKTDQDIADFLTLAIEDAAGDQAVILSAFATVLRARKQNMSQLAADAGVTRSGMYAALSGKRNPSFATVLKLLDGIGMGVAIVPTK